MARRRNEVKSGFFLFADKTLPLVGLVAGVGEAFIWIETEIARERAAAQVAVDDNHSAALLRGGDRGAKRGCRGAFIGDGASEGDDAVRSNRAL